MKAPRLANCLCEYCHAKGSSGCLKGALKRGAIVQLNDGLQTYDGECFLASWKRLWLALVLKR